MPDIFIATTAPLASWQQACPHGRVQASIEDAEIAAEPVPDTVFWLHQNAGQLEPVLLGIARLRRVHPAAAIVVLANVPDQAEAMRVFAQGATGYCHAYSAAEVLTEVRLVVTHGGLWLGQDVLQRMIANGRQATGTSQQQIDSTLAKLSPREQQVALQAAEGKSNKEIASELDITERTVKAHLTAVFERLAIRDRLQLALMLNDRNAIQN